jgi:hypothetical protein
MMTKWQRADKRKSRKRTTLGDGMRNESKTFGNQLAVSKEKTVTLHSNKLI